MKKPCAEDDSYSPISRLPDELLLLIFNKIMDLKTLCICKRVSKRFSYVVLQIDSVSLTVSSEYDINSCNDALVNSRHESFLVAMASIRRSTRLKSLHIHLPFPGLPGINFKWKVQVSSRLDSFMFVSPDSIHTTNTNTYETSLQNEEEEEEDEDVTNGKYIIALNCYKDALYRLTMLSQTYDFRSLEYVSITDAGKWGTICFNSREKISKVWDLIRSVDARQRLNLLHSPCRISCCYIPLLKLPASGYVMKGVTMILIVRGDLPDDSVVDVDKEDGIEQDKEEAAYREAMIEIINKHGGSFKTNCVA